MAVQTNNKTVLLFGSFDPLHEGHRDCFAQARRQGDRLVVVVASDASIREGKQREPHVPETERLAEVRQEALVDEVLLGDDPPGEYGLLARTPFSVLAVGYDQRPDDAGIRNILRQVGKEEAEVVRLKPYYPERFKSSLFRTI